MLALCHVLVDEDLHDRGFLDRCCSGGRHILATLGDRTPEWAEGISGVPASTVRDLARRMAAGRTMITTTWSLQRAEHGEQPVWASIALAALLGQIGLPGGGFGNGYGSMADVGIGHPRVRVPGLPAAIDATRFVHPRRARRGHAAAPRRALRLRRRAAHVPARADRPLDRRQPVPPPPGPQPPAPGARAAGHRPRPGALLDGDGAPRRHRPPGHDDARARRHRRRAQRHVRDRHASRRRALRRGAQRPRHPRRARRPARDGRGVHGGARRAGLARAPLRGARRAPAARRSRGAELRGVLGARLRGAAGPRRRPGAVRGVPRRSRGPPAADADRAGSSCTPRPSRRSATTTRPATPRGSSPASGTPHRARSASRVLLIANNPARRLHSQHDHGAHSQAGKVQGREPIRLHPADAAARGIADGDVVRVFNDRGACLAGAVLDDGAAPRRRPAVHGRVVRPRGPGRRRAAVRARQRQRAHARRRHVAARAGLHRPARPRGDRSPRGRAAADPRLRRARPRRSLRRARGRPRAPRPPSPPPARRSSRSARACCRS